MGAKNYEFTQTVYLDLQSIVGEEYISQDDKILDDFSADALKKGRTPDCVIWPGSVDEVAEIASLCNQHRVALTPRGGGTGYSGGAVPSEGGVVLSMQRLNRILEIDRRNLVAVVEPNVITANLQDEVEKQNLFYPPDPASSSLSAIGGNVAECAGGPRAFKYGTTKAYVLGVQAVLPTGEIIETGGKTVKNVVGYDLTKLLVGSEGTLAIITKVILRLIPKPAARKTLLVDFSTLDMAIDVVEEIIDSGIVPSAIEILDHECLAAMKDSLGLRKYDFDLMARLILEVDGSEKAVEEEGKKLLKVCQNKEGVYIEIASSEEDRQGIWEERRGLSIALRNLAPVKINHDVVVPKGNVLKLFDVIQRLRDEFHLPIPSFGHVGDGNIHVNILFNPSDQSESDRARAAEEALFRGVIDLEGSISGEHGIGFTKAKYLRYEVSSDAIDLMKRLKEAFDPNEILNPSKIFPRPE